MVPKALREALGLSAGTTLEALAADGQLVLRPVGPATRVVRRRGRPVVEVEGPVDVLTGEEVRDLVEQIRR